MTERWDKLLDGNTSWDEVRCHLEDSFQNGDFTIMKQEFIEGWQDEAQQAYDRIGGVDGFQALQAVMLAEIALQLRKQNEVLEQIVKQLKVGVVVEQA